MFKNKNERFAATGKFACKACDFQNVENDPQFEGGGILSELKT